MDGVRGTCRPSMQGCWRKPPQLSDALITKTSVIHSDYCAALKCTWQQSVGRRTTRSWNLTRSDDLAVNWQWSWFRQLRDIENDNPRSSSSRISRTPCKVLAFLTHKAPEYRCARPKLHKRRSFAVTCLLFLALLVRCGALASYCTCPNRYHSPTQLHPVDVGPQNTYPQRAETSTRPLGVRLVSATTRRQVCGVCA